MSLQHLHPHKDPGDTWLMGVRDEPGRGWKAQSDLISSPGSYAVVRIKSSGLTSAQTWSTRKTQRDRVKREVGGGIGMGNTCNSMADSCQCMTKNTTIL